MSRRTASKLLVFVFLCSLCFGTQRYDMPRKIDLFNDLITQSTTPASPKCQCLPPTTPSTPPNCIPYDSRLQAASLEEAIVAFPDLTITRQEKTQQSTATLNNCKTKQCRDCYKDLRSQLRKVGLLPGTIDQVFHNQRNFTTCQKYRFARQDKGVYEKKKKAKQHYDWDYVEYDEDEDDDYFWDGLFWKKKRNVLKKIVKRDVEATTAISQPPNSTAMNSTGIIGIRFPISCTTRGVTPDGLGTVSLCSTCWVWRRLPSTYYPAYLNEVVCDYADTSCLSGYASCQTGTQQLNVLRNDSGKLIPISVSAGINCECRLAVGSTLESLVLGQGISKAMPPIDTTSTKPPNLATSTTSHS
ncbi:uncharacterized protein CELE_B0222.11 [Caenorhabditis elegans]|uniref:Uncharacterized protein n=1 Tax=Caenorhabditis elegans TaxID=6239 RepID=Q4PIU5_CAEEL|nr:Uncharacterized protein CELE_B0222.11 [Caenorhabditis elegans]CCD61424.1 Uncharacterized protein CELE_B0222.11 [Caenorhabditis elegans]|eukprot:NP_001033464.1 Uncharacterized protein CELE_B0222.11 [Caenorhabditis elegans]